MNTKRTVFVLTLAMIMFCSLFIGVNQVYAQCYGGEGIEEDNKETPDPGSINPEWGTSINVERLKLWITNIYGASWVRVFINAGNVIITYRVEDYIFSVNYADWTTDPNNNGYAMGSRRGVYGGKDRPWQIFLPPPTTMGARSDQPDGSDEPSQSLQLPTIAALAENYPNPFNSQTSISIYVPEDSQVKVAVYDISGRLVCELQNGAMSAGEHNFSWQATGLSSGIYLLKAEVGSEQLLKKMTYIR